MNDLQNRQEGLPANIDDLAKFALIGREKLVAVRAEIRAIETYSSGWKKRTEPRRHST